MSQESEPFDITRPDHKWREEGGVIYFSVTSNGATGEEWIKRLEGQGFKVSYHAKDTLRSNEFQPTTGVTTEIAVISDSELCFKNEGDCMTQDIRAEAKRRKFETPNAEVACLIREMFANKEIEAMGFSFIVTMHKPIDQYNQYLLIVDRLVANDDGSCAFTACYDESGIEWNRLDYDFGFAFAVSK